MTEIVQITNTNYAICCARGIFIAPLKYANDMDWQGAADISTIINLTGFILEEILDVTIESFQFNDFELISQNEQEKALAQINKIIQTIKIARDRNSKVLILDGNESANRAPAIAAAYMVKYLGISPDAAIASIKAAHIKKNELMTRILFNQSFCDLIHKI